MSERPNPKVSIWKLQDRRKDGKPKPWIVRWKVQGRRLPNSEPFVYQAQADEYRRKLAAAASKGERFDTDTGLPVSWLIEEFTVAEFTHDWFRQQWPTWAAGSRRAAAESIVRWLPLLVRKGAPAPPVDIRTQITKWLTEDSEMPAYLQRWSLLLTDFDKNHAQRVWSKLGLTLDGKRALNPKTAARMRVTFKAVMKSAVSAGQSSAVEWPKVSRRGKEKIVIKCDPSRVPSADQMRQLLEALGPRHTRGRTARDYRQLFGLMYYCGLRPGEAYAVNAADLTLPESGWGRLIVSRTARIDTISTWLDGDPIHGPVKAGAVGREVPIPPQCVELLRENLPESGFLFEGVSRRAVSRAWALAKSTALPPGPLQTMDPYYCRHAYATHGLRAGIPIGVIAERLGNSREMVATIYDGWLDGDNLLANDLFEKAFG
jgi:integrase